MKEKITDQPLEVTTIHGKGSTEVELKKLPLHELEISYGSAILNKVRGAFMQTCGKPNKDFIDTEGMSKPKAIVGCAMSWKNTAMKLRASEALKNSPMSGVLKSALSPEELKQLEVHLKNNNKDDSLPKALKAMTMKAAETEETANWEKVASPDREEYAQAKTKKEWEKIDKKELDRDTKKEKEEHEKDAVKDDKSKIKKLKKGKPSEKKEVEIHDLKKDQELDKEDKTKYTKAGNKTKADHVPWHKEDEEELEEDDPKEKKKHEKDAVKDDKKQIKDLKKDIKEDKKDSKKSKASDYSEYWEYAAERFGGKKRSALKDSDFLDPKRRSFPVVSCKNVRAAVSTWGMYKGPMSFEEFKSKLTRRAKKLGCEGSLPTKWKDK